MVQCIRSRNPILRLVHQKSIQQIIRFHRAQILIAGIDKIWPVNLLIPNKKNLPFPQKKFLPKGSSPDALINSQPIPFKVIKIFSCP